MLRTWVVSPYAGDVVANVAYARACMRDCFSRGEAPFAPHLLYTQEGMNDDDLPEERALGMRAGRTWMRSADKVVVYWDRGLSRGMVEDVVHARTGPKQVVEWRRIAGWAWCVPLERERVMGLALRLAPDWWGGFTYFDAGKAIVSEAMGDSA